MKLLFFLVNLAVAAVILKFINKIVFSKEMDFKDSFKIAGIAAVIGLVTIIVCVVPVIFIWMPSDFFSYLRLVIFGLIASTLAQGVYYGRALYDENGPIGFLKGFLIVMLQNIVTGIALYPVQRMIF